LETISPDEIAYHRQITADLRAAQAAWESWGRFLAAKYGLALGESITEQGVILRHVEPPPTSDTP
jgi:hypothetical protein